MKFKKPICFFDIEATGLDISKDKILTLAVCKVGTDGMTIGEEFWKFNPGFNIPASSTRIHGITDEDVMDSPVFVTHAKEIHELFSGCDVGGFNVRGYDIPLLWEEFSNVDIKWDLTGVNIIDASEIFRRKERHRLEDAVRKYCGREHVDAHSATADNRATMEVLIGEAKAYPDIGAMDSDQLHAFCTEEEWEGQPATRFDLCGFLIKTADGVVRYTSKKVRGVPVGEDPGFGQWMMRNDFPRSTKEVLGELLGGY